jgi:NAD(P)-dependent dehydrogenase (short-subunit alcohol dehydrogenase family)
VRSLARRGWDLALIARGDEGLKASAGEAVRLGVRAIALPADVADHRAVDEAADAAVEGFGRIDAWVNDAMTGVFGPFVDVPIEDFRRVVDVTFLGYVHGTRAALRHMLAADRGVIVQVGSALAYRGIPLQSAYCASKHAIQGFTDSIRAELYHVRSRVRICEVHLPAMNTPQFRWVKSLMPSEARPVPPIYQPEIAADAIAWVAEHPRREMWVGATTVATILANEIAPGLLDRYLGRTGYRSQQTDQPLDPDRPFNLYEPVEGDHGAHGVFGDASFSLAPQVWASKHRRALAAIVAAAGAGLLVRRTRGAARGPIPQHAPDGSTRAD